MSIDNIGDMKECDHAEYRRIYDKHKERLTVFSSYSGGILGMPQMSTAWGIKGMETALIASECEDLEHRREDNEAWTYWKNADLVAALDREAANAAEVERLTAERDFFRAEADRLERDFNTASLAAERLTAERDALRKQMKMSELFRCGFRAVNAKNEAIETAELAISERDAAVRERDAAVEALRTVVGSSSHVEAINIAGRALIFTTTSPSQHTGIDQPADPYSGEFGNINLRMLATKMHAALGLLKRQGCYHPGMDSMREEGFKHGLNLGDKGPEDHIADTSKMVGERETAPYIPEQWGGPEGEE